MTFERLPDHGRLLGPANRQTDLQTLVTKFCQTVQHGVVGQHTAV